MAMTTTAKKLRCTGGRHRWTSDHKLVGGVESNPGVWGTGGRDWVMVRACVRCGCGELTTHTYDRHNCETVRVRYTPGRFEAESVSAK